ncbi:MAG TPA: hypothetical protein VNT55_24600 [Baekduia sp.]|nr:hypothetical protein [Baekduia sp.]
MGTCRRPLHAVIVGGGPAATEVALVIREHVGAPVRLTFVVPASASAPRALRSAEPFVVTRRRRCDVPALAASLGAEVRRARAAEVDADRHRLLLSGGDALHYDLLVLAPGARPRQVFDSAALTLFGDACPAAVDRVVTEIERDRLRSLAFVIPPGTTRALSLYELAVLVATEARARNIALRMRLFTPEVVPLERFGARVAIALTRLLATSGVEVVSEAMVFEGVDDRLRLGAADRFLAEDRVVALPVLDGPAIPGVPMTADGFFPVDDHGAVLGPRGRLRRGRRHGLPGQARRRRVRAGGRGGRRDRRARRRRGHAAGVGAGRGRAPARRPRHRRPALARRDDDPRLTARRVPLTGALNRPYGLARCRRTRAARAIPSPAAPTAAGSIASRPSRGSWSASLTLTRF